MNKDDGRSASGRAVVNGAGQAVSALRASVPSAVTVVTQREIIKAVPDRFLASFGSALDSMAAWKPGWTRRNIANALQAMEVRTCTPQEIDAVIGRKGWASNECDVCGEENAPITLRIGDEPDYEARWQDICLPCLVNLGTLAAQAIEARRAETQGGSVHESAVTK